MHTIQPITRPSLAVDSGVGRLCQAGELFKSEPARSETDRRIFGQFALVYILDGAGSYDDARGVVRDIAAGDLIIIFPRLAHRYGPDAARGQTWREFYLVFEGPVFEAWQSGGVLNPATPVLHLQPVAAWHRRMIGVLDSTPPVSPQASLAEVCRMQQLLADMLAHAAGGIKSHDESWLARARLALDTDGDLHAVADQLCCSYATLRRRFTELAGMAPTRYRARLVIERACDLMHRTDLSDKQIAAELGFCDEFHFSRRFKQIVGISPRAYRASLP